MLQVPSELTDTSAISVISSTPGGNEISLCKPGYFQTLRLLSGLQHNTGLIQFHCWLQSVLQFCFLLAACTAGTCLNFFLIHSCFLLLPMQKNLCPVAFIVVLFSVSQYLQVYSSTPSSVQVASSCHDLTQLCPVAGIVSSFCHPTSSAGISFFSVTFTGSIFCCFPTFQS